jgi:hypothetical protein
MLEEKIVISDPLLYRRPPDVVFELTMLVMIVIDCIGSYESNYDIITTTTVASEIVNNLDHAHETPLPLTPES